MLLCFRYGGLHLFAFLNGPLKAFDGAKLGELEVFVFALGQHFAVQVADLAATVAELRAAGLTVSDPAPVGRSLQAFLDDPSGNTVELHEVGGAPPAP